MANKNIDDSDITKFINDLIPPEELKPKSIDEVVKLPSFYSKMQKCEEHFGKSYSELSHDIQNAVVLRRLQQMVNTLMLNPIWKKRIEEAGLKEAPKNIEEWEKLPISDKDSTTELLMGSRPGLVVPLSYNGFEIVASGGTSSGTPAEIVYSLRELEDTYKIAGDFIGKYVLKKYLKGNAPKWVMTTLADYQMWSSGTMVGGVLQHIPGINYIGAGPVNKDVYQHILSYEGPKVIMGISQSIALLADFGEGLDEEARKSFHVALYGSGLLSHSKQVELKKIYPNLEIMSYFAATQAETIGIQLSSESYLVSVPGLHFIEIVDENGHAVKEGEEGDLVVTRLHAHEAPLIRFKVGDRMIRRPNIDKEHLKTQQFQFVGRSSDIIHLGDTQYQARNVYESLQRKLKKVGIDLNDVAKEIQFVNDRRDFVLYFIASADNPEALNYKLINTLGKEGIKKLFIEALAGSLSIFNKAEANANAIEKVKYDFNIKFVNRGSDELYTTKVGKIPLIRDVF